MSALPSREAALLLRDAVAALSRRMPVEPGDLVPEAGTERLARLADKLERGDSASVDREDIVALDTWIRAADSFTLHADAAEVQLRADLGQQLRAVRRAIAPEADVLSTDPRDG